MFRTLVKKQFAENFRNYFVSRKTGKVRSKGGVIGMFVLFGVLMLFVCAISFVASLGLSTAIHEIPMDMNWLFFAVMGTASLLMGVFGSVFNTYSALYLPRDNEMLLSMPIKPKSILMARMTFVYLISLLYSGIVWFPAVLAVWIEGYSSAAGVIFGLILVFVIALFVTVITCVLGWVIALIASRLRNKSFIVLILTLGFMGIYFYFCGNMSNIMESIISNIAAVGAGIKKWGGILYILGSAGTGVVMDMLIFCGITAVMSVICLVVLSRNYARLLLKKPIEAAAKTKIKEAKRLNVRAALLLRDLKRLTASSTYMMNACFGVIIMPILAVVMVIQISKIKEALAMVYMMWAPAKQLLPIGISVVASMIAGMDFVSLPSVSMEGKSLWVLQTLPVSGKQILRSKRDLHIILNAIPGTIFCVVIDSCLSVPTVSALIGIAYMLATIWFNADLGLLLGVKHANLSWTNETAVIKENMLVLLQMLISVVIFAVTGAGVYFLREVIDPQITVCVCALILLVITAFLEKWISGSGSKLIMSL